MIRRIALVILICIPLLAIAPARQGLEDLFWLEGEWQRQARSGAIVERWWRTEVGLVGESAPLGASDGAADESLMLTLMGNDVFYIAKPRQNTYPVGFRLVERDDDRFVFENTEHDFPQQIVYQRTGADAMVVTISAPDDDGSTRRIEFHFTRRP